MLFKCVKDLQGIFPDRETIRKNVKRKVSAKNELVFYWGRTKMFGLVPPKKGCMGYKFNYYLN